ncbi:hypothetical protein CDAR_200021 [Caerostris darwini]|uniref:Uncharacterized protein n=1 Tax=Caerostris darwini TaxID=1538125 RepID=A0AAV4PPK8_9ARAC|nr:hypothetical protein CDAR_200021 [Caerostris darwini]
MINGDSIVEEEKGELHLKEKSWNNEIEKVESWLDEHPQFVRGYFIRKATRHMVDSWILFHSAPQGMVQDTSWITNTSSGDPVRNTSARELKSRTSLSRLPLNIILYAEIA